jgi:hypothetical protein
MPSSREQEIRLDTIIFSTLTYIASERVPIDTYALSISPPNNFPTMPFFSSVVRRIIFRAVAGLINKKSLPLLEGKEPANDEGIDRADLGRAGSGR